MRHIALLGSTGSIGESTLEVLRFHPDKFCVSTLAANASVDKLEQQIHEFKPKLVAVYNEEKAAELRKRVPNQKIVSGEEGVVEAATFHEADILVSAIVGTAGLIPTLAAIQAGKTIGLANKEVLVAAGSVITEAAKEHGVDLLPIDSEHNALFQCLEGEKKAAIRRLILTASGGAFRDYSQEQLQKATLEDALRHPTWSMGPKVTIDSSTLMNKGLEMIEAFWLFGIPHEQIDVVIHPQSIIHSMVEFCDGSIIAQMNQPNMINPIQHVLSYPERHQGMFPPFDFTQHTQLTFSQPDKQRFRCLDLAYEAVKVGGSMPCFLNAANEILVERFMHGELSWWDISRRLERLMEKHQPEKNLNLTTVLEIDKEARQYAQSA